MHRREDLHAMFAPLRKSLALVASVLDIYRERVDIPAHKVEKYMAMAAESMAELHQNINNRLEKHLTRTDKKCLVTVFGVMASHHFIHCALTSPALHGHMAVVEEVIEGYLGKYC